MKLSDCKSLGVIFTHRHQTKIKNPLMLGKKPLKKEDRVKFLGMIFDRKLNWKEHVTYITDRCKPRLNILRCLSETEWGASKETLLIVYRALIRSVLDYGACALDGASAIAKARLDTIQCQALRICCGAMQGTALSALQVETGEPPLALRRLRQQINFACKIKAIKDHPAKEVLQDHWTNHYGKEKTGEGSMFTKISPFFNQTAPEIQPAIPKSIPPWKHSDIKIDVELTKKITKADHLPLIMAFAAEKIEEFKEHLAIYTDGSKSSEGRVASAFYIPELNIQNSARISNNLSVFTSELVALKLALLWIKSSVDVIGDRRVALFTDSFSSLTALQGKHSNSRPKLVEE